MKYHDYIHSIEPNIELKKATKERVQNAIKEQNRIKIKKRNLILSSAACFIVLAVSIASFGALSRNAPYIESNTNNTETSRLETETTNNSKSNMTTTTFVSPSTSSVQGSRPNTSVSQVTTNSSKTSVSSPQATGSQSDKIIINTNNSDNKYGAQKIIINGKVYLQYCNQGVKQGWGEDNGNVVIDKADIGEQICTLNAKNLISDWTSLSTESSVEASNNTFNKAKAYRYNPCKNGTVIVVGTSKNYYLFTLNGFSSKMSTASIIDLYSASGNNSIRQAVIYKKDNKISTIKNTDKTNQIVNLLNKVHQNYSVNEIISKGYIGNEEYEYLYQIIFTFDDSTVLKVNINEHYFQFNVSTKNDYGYYELSKADFEAISAIIDK